MTVSSFTWLLWLMTWEYVFSVWRWNGVGPIFVWCKFRVFLISQNGHYARLVMLPAALFLPNRMHGYEWWCNFSCSAWFPAYSSGIMLPINWNLCWQIRPSGSKSLFPCFKMWVVRSDLIRKFFGDKKFNNASLIPRCNSIHQAMHTHTRKVESGTRPW